MCGRFQQPGFDQLVSFYDEYLGGSFYRWPTRYNIAPTQEVVAFKQQGRVVTPFAARWGFDRPWSKRPLINAMSESAHHKKTFRESFAQRRCLIPSSGYYEWKGKQPYWIRFEDGRPMLLYGLWEPRDGPPAAACTVLTTNALPELAEIHDRMPCLTDTGNPAWLAPEFADEGRLIDMLRTVLPEGLIATPVSSYVNKAGNEGSDCVAPA